jgi:hypothetical protein
MSESRISRLEPQSRRISLFDSNGLPWTAHLSLGWILWVFALTGGMAAIPIGLWLGAWIRTKTRSALVFIIFALLTVSCAALFLPDSVIKQQWADAIGAAAVILWFTGALIGRYQIARYYEEREGSEFRLSVGFTLLFGVWYLNYRIRSEFPPDTKRNNSA